MPTFFVTLASAFLMSSCSLLPPADQNVEEKVNKVETYEGEKAQALFAGGCFWCIEASMEKLDGVITAISGFAGGQEADPAYEEVAYGKTGHRESVLVIYDPTKISYRELVDQFWTQFDPTDSGGQFADRGFQYSPAVFYETEEEKKIIAESKAALEASGKFDEPNVTAVEPAGNFYPAEEYHQDYYKKNPIRYDLYARGSGRTGFLEETWGK